MEQLTWFGAYGASFAPLFFVMITLTLIAGLCAALLSFTNSSPQASFSLFNGVAVLLLLLLVGLHVCLCRASRVQRGRRHGACSTLGRLLLGDNSPRGLCRDAGQVHGNTFFDDSGRLYGALMFKWSVYIIGVASILLWLAGDADLAGNGLSPSGLPAFGKDGARHATGRRVTRERLGLETFRTRGILADIVAVHGRFGCRWWCCTRLSMRYKRRLGLYGKLFDSVIGMIGFRLVMFMGVHRALWRHLRHDPRPMNRTGAGIRHEEQSCRARRCAGATADQYPFYLLGGDNLARDIFPDGRRQLTIVVGLHRWRRFLPSWWASRSACRPGTTVAGLTPCSASWPT